MTLRELFANYRNGLLDIYTQQEAENLVFWLFEEFLKVKRSDILKNQKMEKLPEAMQEAMDKLKTGIPIQYVLGKAPFYGREFMVSPAVLIPRNVTEELVYLIINENPAPALRILDIGTGSGCIPITLALEMPVTSVYGCDISTAALVIATENADKLAAKVDFFYLDILEEDIPIRELDIIVSNPPYIKSSEKKLMHQNVLENEPHLALFVPEDNPLVFYRKIASQGLRSLKKGGKIYFEINEALGEETKLLLENTGYKEIRIRKDLNDKDRMISAIFPYS